jgi:hypothetical protein
MTSPTVPPLPHALGASVFDRLEELLPFVGKPIQYVGGEVNAVSKDWDSVDVHWALMYPDAYEVGAPNQGVQILYEVINEREDALAERTYAVWPDLEALMRDAGVPQFTVDAHRAVGDFDLLGVSFSTELGYTNLLTALDLARIPLLAADRDESHPVVVAGGHAGFNPEPTGSARADPVDGRSSCSASPGPAPCTSRPSMPWTTCRTAASSASRRRGPRCPGGCASTR